MQRALSADSRRRRLLRLRQRQFVHDLLDAVGALRFRDRLATFRGGLYGATQGYDPGHRFDVDVASLDVRIGEELRVDLRGDPGVVHHRARVASRLAISGEATSMTASTVANAPDEL